MPRQAKKTPTPRKTPRRVRQRLAPADRRKQILEGAVSFFAEHGFEGGTRNLAKRLGVTQPLIYNYFADKDELIREVYESVYIGRWRAEWSQLLSNGRRPLYDRLVDFYTYYTDVIFSSDWLRIYLFSGLKGLQINSMWSTFIEDHLTRVICDEIRRENALPTISEVDVTPEEIEAFWLFHGGVFYYGVRRDVYHSPVHLPIGDFIATSVQGMLAALPVIMRAVVRAEKLPV
jgi:AcrR family transcriptional regulator